jgi:hypothetical protein
MKIFDILLVSVTKILAKRRMNYYIIENLMYVLDFFAIDCIILLRECEQSKS